jgi:hypothetical protein
MTKRYRITRTGRRATPRLVTLSDGRKHRLNPTGSHIWSLSDADVETIKSIPGTRLVCVEPEPEPQPKADVPKKVEAKKKGKAKK